LRFDPLHQLAKAKEQQEKDYAEKVKEGKAAKSKVCPPFKVAAAA